jgi:hypothetical protein
MNVIDKFFNNLPKHWQDYIKKNNWFDLSQFNSFVSIQFEDGSNMFFNYAFLVRDEQREEIAVFTEHCGYYVFPTRGLEHYHCLKHEKTQDAVT